MVEGPGCKIKGEKIKSKLINRTVKAVSGNAVDREIKPKKGVAVSQFDVLAGRTLTEVQTLGKELFMYFGDVCLRLYLRRVLQSLASCQSGRKADPKWAQSKPRADANRTPESEPRFEESGPGVLF